MDQIQLLEWLDECTGDNIWSIEYCQHRGVPQAVIRDLADAYESGFRSDSQTIYYNDRKVGQFEGVRDVDLAIWIASQLGVDTKRIIGQAISRSAMVVAIKESIEEG